MLRLKGYKFTDVLGHSLENCEEWIELITRLAAVEKENTHLTREYNMVEKQCQVLEKERDALRNVTGQPQCWKVEHMDYDTLKADLAAVEHERDEWQRSADLVTRTLISTKADLAAAMKGRGGG